MTTNDRKNAVKLDYVLAGTMIAMGLIVAGLSLAQLPRNSLMAQVSPPPASTTPPVPAGNDNGPAESKPGGTRPTTPAPEPARPDADTQKAGAAPALPAAPAEKMGEPIQK